MLTYDSVLALVRSERLDIFGGFSATETDVLPNGTASVLLLGPDEPGFWRHVTVTPEFGDGQPHPLDRWSERIVTNLAHQAGGSALFPFGGPPYRPFIAWAERTGRAWPSPVGMLVHDRAGLFVSYRGALALPYAVDLPPTGRRPCESCAGRPCLSACPVGALTEQGYDLGRCHAYLDTTEGSDCMTNGCAVRRSCPVSEAYGRRAEQSAFHMKAFHP